jgi:CheY-like chemotaxis protein
MGVEREFGAYIERTLFMAALILVVDDDDAVRTAVAEILVDAGYPVLEAADARDALAFLDEYPSIALLFTDINMPVLNGYVLADMAVTRWPLLRVLYTTDSPINQRLGEQPGFLHGEMLVKPYRAAKLTAAVIGSLTRPLPPGDPCRRSRPSVERPPAP